MSDGRIRLRTRPVAEIPEVPGAPEGVRRDLGWEIDGTGLVGVGWLHANRPGGEPNGKRVLWGPGVWPAEMNPSPSPRGGALLFTSAGTMTPLPTCAFIVQTDDGPVNGVADQPGGPGGPLIVRLLLFPIVMLNALRNSKRKIRLRAAGRTWWLRGGFKIRVYREDGFVVLKQKGRRWSADPAADQLDLTVALLAVSSFDRDAYSVQ